MLKLFIPLLLLAVLFCTNDHTRPSWTGCYGHSKGGKNMAWKENAGRPAAMFRLSPDTDTDGDSLFLDYLTMLPVPHAVGRRMIWWWIGK
jgi:hypothetical protein